MKKCAIFLYYHKARAEFLAATNEEAEMSFRTDLDKTGNIYEVVKDTRRYPRTHPIYSPQA